MSNRRDIQIIQNQLADELEYRVRTSAALKLGGHDINAEVVAGRQRVILLTEQLIALANHRKETDR